MQRKQYRIETLLSDRRTPDAAALAPLAEDADGRMLTRSAADLAAAIEDMEKACSVVLGSAERVDENAQMLMSASEAEDVRALAHDIREQMARVFEACHFQDLAGQRIAKVIDLLTGLDERLSGVAESPALAPAEPELINGPRLDGASGHVTQDEIDKLFR